MSEILFCDSVGCAELSVMEGATNGPLKFQGKFQEANAVNKNKRMYPFDVLEQNMQRLAEAVKNRGLLGELDHPQDSIIHFDKASHLITKLWWDGQTLMGEGEILPTPHGMILRKLLESGVRIGISSRGVGNGQVNNEGVLVIGESYRLITFDAVADPSTFAAYQKVVAGAKHEANCTVVNNLPEKNETRSINKINENALVAFTGQFIQKLVNDIKKREVSVMNNDKILEAISGLIPEDVREKVSTVFTTALKEAVADLEKEYQSKLDEGYQELAKKREEDKGVAEQGYAQAYEVITDLRNRLDVQKQEFEHTLEEEYAKAYEMLQEERNKNETLADDIYKEYDAKLLQVKEWLIDRVDEFLAKKGDEYYEQARRDVLNDPYLAEHRVAFEKVLEVASDFISDDDCIMKTSAKVDELTRQVEHTKVQVKTLESKNMRLMTENNQMKDYMNQTKELLKEHNEKNERVEKAKNVEGRGQIVNDPKREVVIGEAVEDAAANKPINENKSEPETIADQWNYLASYRG